MKRFLSAAELKAQMPSTAKVSNSTTQPSNDSASRHELAKSAARSSLWPSSRSRVDSIKSAICAGGRNVTSRVGATVSVCNSP
jgi:hypothetical protein